MSEWWHDRVIFPVYAHDWWFVGFIVLAIAFVLLAAYASGVEEEKRENRLLDIESRLKDIETEATNGS